MIKSIMVDGIEALKLMVDGAVAWERGGLPSGYRKCKFIQSDGHQYISVDDYIPEIGDSFSIDFIRQNNNTGSVLSAGTGLYQLIIFNSYYNNYIYMKYFSSGDASYYLGDASDKPFNIVIYGDGKIVMNDITINTEVPKNKQPVNTNLYLFIRANLQQTFNGKILGLRIERNGETIRNFVPTLRISNGKPGMLDTVTKNFYTNQGTGEFIYELA